MSGGQLTGFFSAAPVSAGFPDFDSDFDFDSDSDLDSDFAFVPSFESREPLPLVSVELRL